jgi:hypothetical protein
MAERRTAARRRPEPRDPARELAEAETRLGQVLAEQAARIEELEMRVRVLAAAQEAFERRLEAAEQALRSRGLFGWLRTK